MTERRAYPSPLLFGLVEPGPLQHVAVVRGGPALHAGGLAAVPGDQPVDGAVAGQRGGQQCRLGRPAADPHAAHVRVAAGGRLGPDPYEAHVPGGPFGHLGGAVAGPGAGGDLGEVRAVGAGGDARGSPRKPPSTRPPGWRCGRWRARCSFLPSHKLLDVQYAAFARSLGLTGFRVVKPEDVEAGWRAGLEADGPAVIEFLTDPTDPMNPAVPPHATWQQMEATAESIPKGRRGPGVDGAAGLQVEDAVSSCRGARRSDATPHASGRL
jgi:hypothetical protein